MIKNTLKNNIWSKVFIFVLVFQAIGELILGLTILFNFQFALENVFGIAYTKDLDILGVALGLYLLLLTTLMAVSAFWIIKKNYYGTVIGMISGLFLVIFGITAFLKLGDTSGLIFDSIRGLLTVFLAYKVAGQIQEK